MTLYLLNSPVITGYGLWRFSGPLSGAQARELAVDGFVSAVGHEASARLLSQLLAAEVPARRIRAELAPGDRAIVLRLLERPPEGAVLDDAALRRWPSELSLLERIE